MGATCSPQIDQAVCVAFYSQLREARARVLGDAEAYADVVHVIERLGMLLSGRIGDLGKYEPFVAWIASASPLAIEVPELWRSFHTPFGLQYRLIRHARNDAVHQGAFARHLAAHSVGIALTLEDALMSSLQSDPIVADFMVRTVVTSEFWHPVSYARQQMLSNSYSFLPIRDEEGHWHLLADVGVARFLAVSEQKRKSRLAMRIGSAVREGSDRLHLEPANFCPASARLADAIGLLGDKNQPVLIYDDDAHRDSVIGIVSAFDCL